MTTGRNIRAGRAFVEIGGDDKELAKILKRAQRRLSAFGTGLIKIGALGIAAGAAFAPFGVAVVKAASDSEEALSRFAAVFKSETEAAATFAETLADRVGRSALQIKDALGVFQSFFVGLGFNNGTSRQLSQQLASLALDFASFNNISDDEAITRFIAALSGSGEVLDRFGINIKQAALQQQLLADGVEKSWSEVTEQEKAIARLNIIMRTMGDQGSVGDATRTAGSFANVMKRLQGEIRDTAVVIGQSLVPILKPVVATMGTILGVVRKFAEQNKPLVSGVFLTAAGVAALGVALLASGVAIAIASVAMGGLAAAILFVKATLLPLGIALGAAAVLLGTATIAVGSAGLAFGSLGNAWRAAMVAITTGISLLSSRFFPVLEAIRNALASGDVTAAARVLWASLELIWTRGVVALTQIVAGLGIAMVEKLQLAFFAVELAFNAVFDRLGQRLANFIDKLTGTVAGTVAVIGLGFAADTVLGGGEKVADDLKTLLELIKDSSDTRIKDAENRLDDEIERAKNAAAAARAAQLEAFNIDFGGVADSVRRTIDAAGTFGGRVIEQQFGGASSARQQLEEAKKTSKNTGETSQAVRALAARLRFT